jgi:hypothetical protein
MSYFPTPKGLVPGSAEYNAHMIEKARGATVMSNGVVRHIAGTAPNGNAERDAASLEKFRSSGSTIRSSGLQSVVATNDEPNG